jgi:hypothetical protein
MINEMKEDVYKKISEFKEDTNSWMKLTKQYRIWEELKKITEILKKNQIEILEVKRKAQ